MKDSKKLTADLNLLLARNNDAHKGYVETAANVARADVKKWMHSYSVQRARFCEELKIEIKSLGGNPDDSTSILGEIHRVWIDLKGNASESDTESMLVECERGETEAFNNYGKVISEHPGMPSSTRKMLERHQRRIKEALTEIKMMSALLTEGA
jgi:uncharacterized protein (TIGR02284 family)